MRSNNKRHSLIVAANPAFDHDQGAAAAAAAATPLKCLLGKVGYSAASTASNVSSCSERTQASRHSPHRGSASGRPSTTTSGRVDPAGAATRPPRGGTGTGTGAANTKAPCDAWNASRMHSVVNEDSVSTVGTRPRDSVNVVTAGAWLRESVDSSPSSSPPTSPTARARSQAPAPAGPAAASASASGAAPASWVARLLRSAVCCSSATGATVAPRR